MINGSNKRCASDNCVLCDDHADRVQTTTTSPTTTMDIGTNTDETNVDTQETNPPIDRVARAKRALEASEQRVKKARIDTKRDQLRLDHQLAMERLDHCIRLIHQAQDELDTCPVFMIKAKQHNINRLQDKRQLALMSVLKAEEKILDFDQDEASL